jgi:hypothetical protein
MELRGMFLNFILHYMETIHILNGDCLLEQLQQTSLTGNFIVCREALVEGPVGANSLADFWKQRAAFIAQAYTVSEDEYFSKTVSGLQQLTSLPENSNVYLWFEDDLFCQVNLWFMLSLLSVNKTIVVYRVFPVIKNEQDKWKGFGIASAQMLEDAFRSAVVLSDKDIHLGKDLWEAYSKRDRDELRKLATVNSPGFHDLGNVVAAHIERFPGDGSEGRPEKTVRKIIESGITDFPDLFAEFSKRDGIYGFSDLQVKRMWEKVTKE